MTPIWSFPLISVLYLIQSPTMTTIDHWYDHCCYTERPRCRKSTKLCGIKRSHSGLCRHVIENEREWQCNSKSPTCYRGETKKMMMTSNPTFIRMPSIAANSKLFVEGSIVIRYTAVGCVWISKMYPKLKVFWFWWGSTGSKLNQKLRLSSCHYLLLDLSTQILYLLLGGWYLITICTIVYAWYGNILPGVLRRSWCNEGDNLFATDEQMNESLYRSLAKINSSLETRSCLEKKSIVSLRKMVHYWSIASSVSA